MKMIAKVIKWIVKKLHKEKQPTVKVTNSCIVIVNIHKD